MALSKKVCLLGSFGVGKTSLVSQYVHGIFSERYQTTIGVKIDKKSVNTQSGDDVTLVVWDIAGEDEFSTVRESYLRGSAGLIFVVDGTRRESLEVARQVERRALDHLGEIPSVWMLNKRDLDDAWELTDEDVAQLAPHFETSAKSNTGVEDAFADLVQRMLG